MTQTLTRNVAEPVLRDSTNQATALADARPWWESMPPNPLIDSPVPFSISGEVPQKSAKPIAEPQHAKAERSTQRKKMHRLNIVRKGKKIRDGIINRMMREYPFCSVCDVQLSLDGFHLTRPFLHVVKNEPVIVCGSCGGRVSSHPPADGVKRKRLTVAAVYELFGKR